MSSRLIFIWSHITSHLILSHLRLSYLIVSYLILSHLILSYFILAYLILSYLFLSYLILSYRILVYLISFLSYLICLFVYCLNLVKFTTVHRFSKHVSIKKQSVEQCRSCHKLHNKPSKHPHQAKNGPTSRLPLPKKHPHSSEKETPIQPHSTPFTPIREHYAPENKQFYNVNRKKQTPIQRMHLRLIYH